ncbi:MAG TPA: alpha-N-acetylglucosaminidase C-terminal domain-containing protein, partial [Fimbriimonas sp.]|nr:alpha-N-acetylglucosaminidase C-terminal domain-containing protein [Fimbriimonas sp.]
ERTAAMLNVAPKGKLIVLDLATNEHAVWRDQPAVRDAGWIYNTLHNYGQTTNLYGNLQAYEDAAYRDLSDPNHGNMLGMGLTPEGIDQNPVVYELMTDAMWRHEHIDVSRWLKTYAASRYGSAPDEVVKAWSLLQQTVYGPLGGGRDSWRGRPSLGPSVPGFDVGKVREASRLLLSQAPSLHSNTLYRRDLVDVTKTWLGALADAYLTAALASFDDDKTTYSSYKAKYLDVLHDLDRLMATRPEHRLSTWIADARKWGTTPAEKDHMERNARMQVTVWGGPELYDYANKEWAGLNEDFMRRRWELFFEALERAGSTGALQVPDFMKWETSWAMSIAPVRESKPEDSVSVASDVFAKYGDAPYSVEQMLHLDADPGIAVGKPTTDSGGAEGSGVATLATDGKISGGFWSASPAPQWLQIDLQSDHPINGVWLFPYYGDGRYYQYKVETSLDGQTWTRVVDESANTRPSTFRGYRHSFPATNGRYVRVTMLKNSANIGVHLYEVKVYESK